MTLIKRIAPFALALTVGLLIAGIFVPVTAPRFDFRRNRGHREWHRRLELENQELRRRNMELENQLRNVQERDWVLGPDVDVEHMPPPLPPRPFEAPRAR